MRSIQRLSTGRKDSSSVFETCMRPRLISPAIAVAKAGEKGRLVLVKRVDYHTKSFSSAREDLFELVSRRE
jgi:hypothetical protein